MSACQVFTLHWQLLLFFWICDPSLFHIFIAVVLWHKYDKIWCDANKRSAVYVPQPHTQFTFFSYLFIFLSFKKTSHLRWKSGLVFFLPFEFFSDLKHQARGVKDKSCFSMASHTWLTLRLLPSGTNLVKKAIYAMVEGDCDEVRDTQSCGRKLSVRCDASSFFLLSLLTSTSVSENIKSGGKNQKYACGLWCQHAGPVRLTPAHIRKHWVSAFTRSVDAAKRRAQDWFRVYQITYCTGRNPPNVKSRCCCFQCERRLKGPRDAFVFGRLGSPLRSLSLAALHWQPWFLHCQSSFQSHSASSLHCRLFAGSCPALHTKQILDFQIIRRLRLFALEAWVWISPTTLNIYSVKVPFWHFYSPIEGFTEAALHD